MTQMEAIISDEDVVLEWESRPVGEPPSCPRDDHPMTRQRQMHTLAGGRFVVTYEVWVCSECDKVFLDRLLKERNRQPKGQVLFDGEDIFVNLSLTRDMAALWRQPASMREIKEAT